MSIFISGRIPSKKNSRNIFVRGGKLLNIPSKQYAAWHKAASEEIASWEPMTYDNVSRIELNFYAPDKRAADLTNKAESIMDLLVDNKIIPDDNWYMVGEVLLTFRGVSKEKPGCDVVIIGTYAK
jgi:hypothetical protein